MHNQLLNTIDAKKMRLYHTLLKTDTIHIKDLVELTDINRSTILRLIKKINDDLTLLNISEFCVVKTDSNFFAPRPNLSFDNHPEKLLLNFYLKNSTPYNLFLKLSHHPRYNIFTLCEDLSLSHSYCLKELTKLKKLLVYCGLDLTKEGNYYSITGDISYKILGSYFVKNFLVNYGETDVSQESLETKLSNINSPFLADKDHLGAIRCLLMRYSFSEFADDLHAIQFKSRQTKEILTLAHSFYPVFNNLNLIDLTTEQIYFTELLLRTNILEIIPVAERAKTGLFFNKHQNNPIIIKAKFLLKTFLNFFKREISENLFGELLYCLTLDLVYAHEFPINSKANFYTLVIPYQQDCFQDTDVYNSVTAVLNHITDAYPTVLMTENESYFIKKNFSSLYILLLKSKTYIFIDTVRTPQAEFALKKQLPTLLSTECFELTSNMSQANLLIVDYPVPRSNYQKIIYCDNYLAEDTWKFLLKSIMDYHIETTQPLSYK
ncbi:helix-turn-helix domain-containing protein [Vagococcus intermedius]|uniref:Helix-turn-helix domain-containing protein n=1 Tax=Vagococcus intermedius TaxID=2991418 RepID=A0AAF0CVK1_9ENTE|nr:helix-turn-helix domain-containing protein [Vagococcus intermedius]WEG73632.1 helix-turn-helix domain-containing protein [Vagococcus intermedius]WEG75716.1 helix-turn-helix domain-containing protein [Vagococcus intermedius]